MLETALAPSDFHFRFHGEGKSSGGTYAWGEFVRGDRRLELHVRVTLGLVRYHVGTESASHDYYLREIGVLERCHYPGFSEDPKEAFLGLARDLAFADDFLTGTGALLRQAAMRESSDNAARHAELMAANVGDERKVENLRRCFRQGKYEDAVAEFNSLTYPERLSEPERKMVEHARKRTRSSKSPDYRTSQVLGASLPVTRLLRHLGGTTCYGATIRFDERGVKANCRS